MVKQIDYKNLSLQVSKVFSPAAPINAQELFAGRMDQLHKVTDVINQRGQHAIVFGERGVGKTSLANILAAISKHDNILTLKTNCDSSDNYESVWRKAFSEIQLTKRDFSMVFGKEPQVELFNFSEYFETLNPENVRQVLMMISQSEPVLIIIDEFDRITDLPTKAIFADTIKTLSDQSINVTVIFVGVADSVANLISEHQSIERALVQIQMPRMSTKELNEILEKGLPNLGMSITANAKNHITNLSQGLPHYTHLMSLHSAREALEQECLEINLECVKRAIKKCINEAQESIRSAYHKAIMSPRKDTIFKQVLLACALAETDDFGYFAAVDVKKPLSEIMGKAYEIASFSRHLNDFCENTRGPLLQKIGKSRRFRFRFINPLMQPFVTMQGFAEGLLGDDFIK